MAAAIWGSLPRVRASARRPGPFARQVGIPGGNAQAVSAAAASGQQRKGQDQAKSRIRLRLRGDGAIGVALFADHLGDAAHRDPAHQKAGR